MAYYSYFPKMPFNVSFGDSLFLKPSQSNKSREEINQLALNDLYNLYIMGSLKGVIVKAESW